MTFGKRAQRGLEVQVLKTTRFFIVHRGIQMKKVKNNIDLWSVQMKTSRKRPEIPHWTGSRREFVIIRKFDTLQGNYAHTNAHTNAHMNSKMNMPM